MQKFFVANNGQAGTAHINREGKLVDFRPLRGVKCPELDEEIFEKEDFRSARIFFKDLSCLKSVPGMEVECFPPKGQEALGTVKATVTRAFFAPTPTRHRMMVLFGVLEGTKNEVELGGYALDSYGCWMTPEFTTYEEKEEEDRKREECNRRFWEGIRKRDEEKKAKIAAFSPAELVPLVHPVWSHLVAGKGKRHVEKWRQKAARHLSCDVVQLPPWMQDPELCVNSVMNARP